MTSLNEEVELKTEEEISNPLNVNEELEKWKKKSEKLEKENQELKKNLSVVMKYNQIYSSYFMISKIESRFKSNMENNDSIALSEKLENLDFSLKFPKDQSNLERTHEKGIILAERVSLMKNALELMKFEFYFLFEEMKSSFTQMESELNYVFKSLNNKK